MVDRWSVTSITKTLLPVLLVLTVLELGGGLTLGAFEATLLRYPSLIVLVPVTIGTAGNLGSILSARVSTAIHLGLLSLSADDDRLLGNLVTTVLLAVSVFPPVGAGAWLIAWAGGGVRLEIATVVTVAFVSGIVLAAVAIVVTVSTTYVAYRAGVDPDDIVLPVVTNVCDVLGVLVLFAVVRVIVI